ncbi:MAG: hypothetical protein Q9224_004549 [Gallowayella concinna]
MTSSTHQERTATAQREADLHRVKLASIDQVNESVRVLRLQIPPAKDVKFLPGQWLDVHLPNVQQAGGFTITSTPKDAQHTADKPGYLELAIQKSPNNPPAAWLWKPEDEILGSDVQVRVGGNFIWPPPSLDPKEIETVAFIAGGVGINPEKLNRRISLLYGTRAPKSRNLSDILFLDRLGDQNHIGKDKDPLSVDLFLSQCSEEEKQEMGSQYKFHSTRAGRIDRNALLRALGPDFELQKTVVYICGPPQMTDEFEEVYLEQGLPKSIVLTEKWW